MDWIINIENIVFSGGGVRGLTFIGVWHILSEEFRKNGKDLYKQIKGFAGTSAGAIIGLLASIGCTGPEMCKECEVLDGMKIIRGIDLLDFDRQWGMHNKQEIVQHIRQILKQYVGNADITFKELFEKNGKNLIITVARVNDCKVLYYSYETVPDLEVWRGVSASMSIPILFAPSRIGEEVLIDGGMLMNLPIDVFPIEKTIAFLLTRTLPYKINSLHDYVMRTAYMALDALEQQKLKSIPLELQRHVIKLDTGGLNSVDFLLTNAQKKSIVYFGATNFYSKLYPDVIQTRVKQIILQYIVYLLGV